MENLAPGIGACHSHEFLRSIQAYNVVSQGTKIVQVAAGSTTQVKNGIGTVALNRIQQSRAVLADVMIPSAIPKFLGKPIVMGDRYF